MSDARGAAPARPRSMLWRLGTLSLAVTALSLVLHLLVITVWMQPLFDGLFKQLAARVQVTRALLQATPAEDRDATMARLKTEDFHVVRVPNQHAAPQALPLLPTPAPLGPSLIERLGPGFDVGQAPDALQSFATRVLWIYFTVDGQAWRVEARGQPPVWAMLGTGIGWLLLAAAAVAASLLVGLRFVVQPIRDLAQHITHQRGALQPLLMPPGASTELHALVDAFNRLADRLRAADRSKQQLLAGVSHDLRTPLARLRLRIETQCDAKVAQASEVELRAVEHIVSQFLAFVHAEHAAGAGPVASLQATALQVIASYAEQGLDVRWVSSAADVALPALVTQRWLTNLIDNALAHGQAPVDVQWSAPTANEHRLAVWDHGPGLSPAQFAQALEPFVRLRQDASIGHCGLGLAIVEQIATQWQAQLACSRDAAGRFGIVMTWPRGGAGPAP
jgi:two-component system, OmpR family, osmolarity sensor histidine kinase EnvZ